MNPTHEDIRAKIFSVLTKVHPSGEFEYEKTTDELCNLFLTILEGLEMEEMHFSSKNPSIYAEKYEEGFNEAVSEQNAKIASLKEQLKGVEHGTR